MLKLIQTGSGPSRLLVLAYFVADHAALLGVLPLTACVMTDIDDTSGRFARGVQSIPEAARIAGLTHLDYQHVLLIGWSAGCQAVREQLRADPSGVDAVLALDGIAGSYPHPTIAQIEPWAMLTNRARDGVALFVLAHTAMGYTEHLRVGPFESTTHMAEIITGTIGDEPPAAGEIPANDDGLYVCAYRSGDIDGPAHLRQQNVVMPDLLRRIVVPWFERRAVAPETPRNTGTP